MIITNDEKLKENIQKNLVFYRKQKKITQKGLADLIGAAATTISGYERGASTPDIDTLVMICAALDVGLYDICGIIASNDTLSEDERRLLNSYRSMNADGRKKLVERADELLDLGYSKGDSVKMA